MCTGSEVSNNELFTTEEFKTELSSLASEDKQEDTEQEQKPVILSFDENFEEDEPVMIAGDPDKEYGEETAEEEPHNHSVCGLGNDPREEVVVRFSVEEQKEGTATVTLEKYVTPFLAFETETVQDEETGSRNITKTMFISRHGFQEHDEEYLKSILRDQEVFRDIFNSNT